MDFAVTKENSPLNCSEDSACVGLKPSFTLRLNIARTYVRLLIGRFMSKEPAAFACTITWQLESAVCRAELHSLAQNTCFSRWGGMCLVV